MGFSSDTQETGVLSTSPVSQIVTHLSDCSRELSEVIFSIRGIHGFNMGFFYSHLNNKNYLNKLIE